MTCNNFYKLQSFCTKDKTNSVKINIYRDFFLSCQQSKVPQADWLRLGLYQPRPRYTDRIYFSTKCMPSKGESKLFHSMMRRPAIKVRDAVAKIAQAKESFYRSDKNLEEYIRVRNWCFCNTVFTAIYFLKMMWDAHSKQFNESKITACHR